MNKFSLFKIYFYRLISPNLSQKPYLLNITLEQSSFTLPQKIATESQQLEIAQEISILLSNNKLNRQTKCCVQIVKTTGEKQFEIFGKINLEVMNIKNYGKRLFQLECPEHSKATLQVNINISPIANNSQNIVDHQRFFLSTGSTEIKTQSRSKSLHHSRQNSIQFQTEKLDVSWGHHNKSNVLQIVPIAQSIQYNEDSNSISKANFPSATLQSEQKRKQYLFVQIENKSSSSKNGLESSFKGSAYEQQLSGEGSPYYLQLQNSLLQLKCLKHEDHQIHKTQTHQSSNYIEPVFNCLGEMKAKFNQIHTRERQLSKQFHEGQIPQEKHLIKRENWSFAQLRKPSEAQTIPNNSQEYKLQCYSEKQMNKIDSAQSLSLIDVQIPAEINSEHQESLITLEKHHNLHKMKKNSMTLCTSLDLKIDFTQKEKQTQDNNLSEPFFPAKRFRLLLNRDNSNTQKQSVFWRKRVYQQQISQKQCQQNEQFFKMNKHKFHKSSQTSMKRLIKANDQLIFQYKKAEEQIEQYRKITIQKENLINHELERITAQVKEMSEKLYSSNEVAKMREGKIKKLQFLLEGHVREINDLKEAIKVKNQAIRELRDHLAIAEEKNKKKQQSVAKSRKKISTTTEGNLMEEKQQNTFQQQISQTPLLSHQPKTARSIDQIPLFANKYKVKRFQKSLYTNSLEKPPELVYPIKATNFFSSQKFVATTKNRGNLTQRQGRNYNNVAPFQIDESFCSWAMSKKYL